MELVSSAYLFNEFPKVSEGELTKTRASMVCEPALAFCARDIGLGRLPASWKRRERRPVEEKEILSHLMRWKH